MGYLRIGPLAWILAVGASALVCCASARGDESKERRLLEAVRRSDGPAVAALLKDGADASAKADGRGSIVEAAIRYGDSGVIRAMIAGGVSPWAEEGMFNGWNALEYTLLRRDASLETVKALLDSGPKLDDMEWRSLPPCMTNAARNNADIMKLLLAHGADANEKSENGDWDALEYAVYDGSAESVRVLLDAGVDASRKSKHRRSVWHCLAVRYRPDGTAEIAEALKAKGAGSPNATDRSGWAPLNLAAWGSARDAIRALVTVGADVNKPGEGGQTPLIDAAVSGDAATVRLLIELKADPNKADARGTSPLYWAICAADPYSRTRWAARRASDDDGERAGPGGSLWDQIDRSDPVGKVKALLDAGADPNIGAGAEWPPLAMAAFIWDETMLPWARAGAASGAGQGSSLDKRVAAGFYAEHDPMAIVRLLVDAGAVRIRSDGVTDPLDLAAQRNDRHRAALMAALAKVKTRDVASAHGEKQPAPAPHF